MERHYRHYRRGHRYRPAAVEPFPISAADADHVRRYSLLIALVVGGLGVLGLAGAILFVLSTSPWFAPCIGGGLGLIGLAVSSYRVRAPISDGSWLPLRARRIGRVELSVWPVVTGAAFFVGAVLGKLAIQEGWAHVPLSDFFFSFLLTICELAVSVRAARRARSVLAIPGPVPES